MKVTKTPKIKLKSGGIGGTGAIHIDEITPTLEYLEDCLNIPLIENTLGSVGKKTVSGDIDVAVKMQGSTKEIADFMYKLECVDIVERVKRGPLVIITRVKIQNYDSSKGTEYFRNGYVQIDFMFDEDIEWLKTFYHAPYEKDSNYKGAHRNIAIGSLCQFIYQTKTKERNDGLSEIQYRYKFSSKAGLVFVVRTHPYAVLGKPRLLKKHEDRIIDGPWKTAKEIAHRLGLSGPECLDSFETVFKSIEYNHGNVVAAQVANDMINNPTVQKLGIPTELLKYEEMQDG